MAWSCVDDWPFIGEDPLLVAALLADDRCLYTAAPVFGQPDARAPRPCTEPPRL
jgi:hypothetical protein